MIDELSTESEGENSLYPRTLRYQNLWNKELREVQHLYRPVEKRDLRAGSPLPGGQSDKRKAEREDGQQFRIRRVNRSISKSKYRKYRSMKLQNVEIRTRREEISSG